MCGLCGFVGRGDIADVQRMCQVMVHRGPDGEGVWCDEQRVHLGHRRLSIIDLAGGSQPMVSCDGKRVVVFNGEIYNHVELRKELEELGCQFATDHSDTEVLLEGWKVWQKGLSERLNGMWAFAIYDLEKKVIYLSRDRFGQKPLYYHQQDGLFVFASELRSITSHQRVSKNLSKTAIQKLFAYGFIPAPLSAYEGIKSLPGGHHGIYDLSEKTFTIDSYWQYVLEPFPLPKGHEEQEWEEHLVELLAAAVNRRLVASDVPVGICLSGGIDSAAVVAMARRNVSTFSIGFEEPTFDESPYADIVAKLFDTKHKVHRISMNDVAQTVPQVLASLDGPFGDTSIVPTYVLSKLLRQDVTVALAGDGGDELFAGYAPFKALGPASWYHRLVPNALHRLIKGLCSCLPVSHDYLSLDFKVKRTLRGLSHGPNLWNPVWLGPLAPGEFREAFTNPLPVDELYSEAISCWENHAELSLVEKTQLFYTNYYLPDSVLSKTDRASMAHSLEVRAPFLDIEFVDFVRKVPWQCKFSQGSGKVILKKALSKVLPKEILYRKKQGFGPPIGRWFQEGTIKVNVDGLEGLLEQSFCKKMLADHEANRADNRLFLFCALTLGHCSANLS